jgi:V/A-type H+-transporting ATPase subunit C
MVKFAYAVGRIRAIEAHLLDENAILRMVEARDFESAYHILRENRIFAEHLDELLHPFDFETLIQRELISVKELLDRLAPGHELLNVFWKKYEENITLPRYLSELQKTAQKYPLPLFKAYAEGFCALYTLKHDLLEGKLDPETSRHKFRYTDYYHAVKIGMECFEKTGSLFALEREIDNQLMKIIKKAKYRVFGIEPLLGFAAAKEIECKIVRLILTAKRMHVKAEAIKERLRIPYV